MEKQATIKPGITPDLDPTEKTAGERTEEEEIMRLEEQDPTSRLAEAAEDTDQ